VRRVGLGVDHGQVLLDAGPVFRADVLEKFFHRRIFGRLSGPGRRHLLTP